MAGERRRSARRASPIASLGLALAAVLLFAGFVALGTWQLQRRVWKLELIAAVDARVHAPPIPAPGPAVWPALSPAKDAYRHVRVRGRLLNGRETLVRAVTEAGAGAWVMTPMRTDSGFAVLVNRGFVPNDRRDPATRRAGEVAGDTTVTGLLRLSETHGGFLQANAPARGRWVSRDVAAIAKARGVAGVAPFFIDADATPNPGGLPVGGLTVIRFPNSHLVYAITWYALALLVLVCAGVFVRERRRSRTAR